MIAIFKNKKNRVNDKLLTTNNKTDKNNALYNKDKDSIYKNIIFYPYYTKE